MSASMLFFLSPCFKIKPQKSSRGKDCNLKNACSKLLTLGRKDRVYNKAAMIYMVYQNKHYGILLDDTMYIKTERRSTDHYICLNAVKGKSV